MGRAIALPIKPPQELGFVPQPNLQLDVRFNCVLLLISESAFSNVKHRNQRSAHARKLGVSFSSTQL